MDNWLHNVKYNELKPTAYDTLESSIKNNVYPYIGDFQIANLEPKDIQNMINELVKKANPRYKDKTLSYSTIKKAYDAVNSCFKLGIIRNEVKKNPCVGVVLPKKKNKENGSAKKIRYLNDEEIKAVTDTCLLKYSNGEMVYRIGHGIIFLMYTGLRIAEFLVLKWNDVDIKGKTIKVNNSLIRARDRSADKGYQHILQNSTKTDAGDRFVPLCNKAVEAAIELKKLNGKMEFVASSSKGKVVHAGHMDKTLRSICKRSGVDPCGVHVLRHTFASLLFRKGVDVKTVSKILGHSDISVTYNTYIHLIKEQEHQAVSLLDL